MPLLYCTFCGNKWEQSVFELWNCPSCEMGVARELILDVSNEEIHQLWTFIRSFHISPEIAALLSSGHNAYFNSTKDVELREFLDLLVIVFDKIVVSGAWKNLADNDDFTQKFLRYYDAGAIIPLDQGDVPDLDMLVKFGHKASKRIIRQDQYISISQHFIQQNKLSSSFYPSLFWPRENLMKILTFLDLGSGNIKALDLYKFLLDKGYIEQLAIEYPYYILNHINGQIVTSQLLGIPLLLGSIPRQVLKWKLGCHKISDTEAAILELQSFTQNLGISIPLGASARQIIKLRESNAGEDLRKNLSDIVQYVQRNDCLTEGELLLEKYSASLRALSEQAKTFGEVGSTILSGSFSTAGAILGGVVGAVIGGVAGSVISLGTKNSFKYLYETTHKNWAFYFYRWSNTV